jgi:hypothetical protein
MLAKHAVWLRGEAHGIRANLSGADLRECDLRESDGITYAQCAFVSHGECGRQLLAVRFSEGDRYFCGCFAGTLAEIDAYIANGAPHLRKTRQFARDFVVAALDMKHEPVSENP